MCHVSYVIRHISCVMCQVLHVKKQENRERKNYKVVELVGRGSVINGAYPVTTLVGLGFLRHAVIELISAVYC